MYTLENTEKIWEEKGKYGSREERIERCRKWFPYYSYLCEQIGKNELRPSSSSTKFISRLFSDSIISFGDSIVDIGAGTGEYTFGFAEKGCKVTALEPCEACADLICESSGTRGYDIDVVQSMWEDFSPKTKYDLCFSSMCPAICNVEEIKRMEAMANKACCLVAAIRGSYDKHRKALMAGLNIKTPEGMTTEAIIYYNVLYLMGRMPCIVTDETYKKYMVSSEKALEQYMTYFKIFGIDESFSVPYIKNYLKEHAENGYLTDESLIKYAMIYWRI